MHRALKRRDGGCRFPGCCNTRFVDGHHIRHWADSGASRLDNLYSAGTIIGCFMKAMVMMLCAAAMSAALSATGA